MREFYLYAERSLHNAVEEIFSDFKIHTVSIEVIKKNNYINKNILLFLNESIPSVLDDFFFLKNNIVIFFLKHNNQDNNKYLNTKIFDGPININKLKDEITTFFVSKSFIYEDIKIWGEKIINTKNQKEVFLTLPEKDILILLFERKKIEKKYLLENVLKLKIDTETKTIESHLTRIRKKLLRINSQIEIASKDNIVFLLA